MGRGFHTTFGGSTADLLTTALTSKPTLRSYHVWYIKNGPGFGDFGNLWSAGGSIDTVYVNSATDALVWTRAFSGSHGNWQITIPASSATTWHAYGLSFDGGSNTNDPIIYLDGASVAVTETQAPTGTFETTTGIYYLGNNSSLSNTWDGILAEFAVWDVILTAAEFAALGKGYSPLLIRRASLVEYIPMLRDNVSRKLAAPTISGTAVRPHARVIMPRKRRGAAIIVPIPPETLFAQACL